MSAKRKFLIDTDAGIDDAQAMMMCLGTSDVDIVAFTTVNGNTTATQASVNVLRLLKAADRPEIPVYQGCEDHIMGWRKPADYIFHGHDGFGDVPDEDDTNTDMIQKKHAVQALTDLSREHPGEITIVSIGPLTNLAIACRMDKGFGKRLKCCFIFGGSYRAVGNTTVTGEFNFYSDPEAASIVLHDLGCPITLTTWELTMDNHFTLDTYRELRSSSSKRCTFLKKIEACVMDRSEKFEFCDEFAMACALCEDVIAESVDVHATVELHGHVTRGQLVVDWRRTDAKNVRIVQKIDTISFKKLLLRAVT